MRAVKSSSQFRKDYKRIARNKEKLKAFNAILQLLIDGQPLPESSHPHQLIGQYRGYTECHIGLDYLLIWLDHEVIELIRLGSHSELFG